ncbi:GNAT family N-acetyltransferase [uncultured Pseudoalteromonas sp.]|uniref:GNAT family N-acetyltransferase n=1 Tax=uncultured Pseudoalteromonas sp. TaxID=114053 RepID=UPI0030C7A2C2
MPFKCVHFNALDTRTLFTIMRGRVDVFVVEQTCPYPELDDVDTHAHTQHLFAIDDNRLLAYARCYEKSETYSAIGRVLVSKSERGKGLATELVKAAIACCQKQWPERQIYIGAQTYLLAFYRTFGFEEVGEQYLEDGIPHQDMVLNTVR